MKTALLVVVLAGAMIVTVALRSPEGSGATWDDESDAGHSILVDGLARNNAVRVIESSLALLPTDAGSGDTLFLFPTHRPAVPEEVSRVQNFLADGGHLVVAADGQNAAEWSQALGLRYQGLPALLPPDHSMACVPVTIPIDAAVYPICLPSPTTFPNLTSLHENRVPFDAIVVSDVQVFLDADQDGVLSSGDQGPVHYPMVLELNIAGRMTAIADADLWRNGFLRTEDGSGNLAFASALVTGTGTVYVDSSGRQDTPVSQVLNPGHRLLSAPGLWGGAALSAVLASVALGTAMAPRARPLLRHNPSEDEVDHDLEQAALAFLQAQRAHQSDGT